jgi:hypothetical protein
MCLGHALPLAGFYGLRGPFWLLLQDGLYVLQRYRLHHTPLHLAVLRLAFFYHPFTKLGGHLLNIAAVQIQLPGDLLIGQIQSHEVQAQDPDLERLMVPSKDGAGQIIEAFPASLTLIALPGRLFLIGTSSGNTLGITKRALSSFWPVKLPDSVVALGIIYQILYVYPHLLDSFCEVEKVGSPFTTPCPWNPT